MQAEFIRSIIGEAGVRPYIAEDDASTKGLWESIQHEIDDSDLFLADISSRSPNILLEVGYAMSRKPKARIGVFIAESIEIPSDLRWLVVQVYSSLPSFREKLMAWLREAIPTHAPALSMPLEAEEAIFEEDFLNKDLFHRRWSTPPGCSYLFTVEGLRFSNAHFPILTSPLGILHDCEFEFDARIEQSQVGWAVLGTKDYSDILPTFCIMFTLASDDRLTPHIWSASNVARGTHYHVYRDQAIHATITRSKDGWMRILTRVRGSYIVVENGNQPIFTADFSQPPYDDVFSSVAHKGGQIGFRCYPGEEATVRRVRVRQIDASLPNEAVQPIADKSGSG
ncbi:MAG TPA: hypothetical protein VJ574_02415 [Candidatus Bathyarchaeia archaeon]|nr:hypothetical protein [Candidatus Bathyarchaeia archaeon]